jgi:murein DD-endopeptidase MepM/ murein hydrolase activator NlpD
MVRPRRYHEIVRFVLACALLALSCAPVAEPAARAVSQRGPEPNEQIGAVAPVPPNAPSAARAPGPDAGPNSGGPASRDLRLIADAEAAYAHLAAELAPRSGLAPFAGPLANWPVNGPISSPFAPRWGGFHNGLDVAAPLLTPVRASATGQVTVAGRPYLAYGDTGMVVMIAHGSNFSTLYVHLDDSRPLPVRVGDRVAAGTVVGFIGLTGWTTGPHVHFMTVAEGRAVDPLRYLP